MTGKATWATPGAGFIPAFEPPPEVRELVLAPDHDDAGLEAIEKAVKGHMHMTFRQLLPPPGMDWCDVLQDYDERMAIQEEPELASSWAERFCNGV
jgi:DNA primase